MFTLLLILDAETEISFILNPCLKEKTEHISIKSMIKQTAWSGLVLFR